MFEKKLMVKSVHYRFYTENDKDEITSKYYMQFSKDSYENPYDLEITYEQYNKLIEDGAIKRVGHSRTELPKLNEKMPLYCYHSITVDLYEFQREFRK
jgi:hypothetical protein